MAKLSADIARSPRLAAAVVLIWAGLLATIAIDSATYSPPSAYARSDPWSPRSTSRYALRHEPPRGDREVAPSDIDLTPFIAPCEAVRRSLSAATSPAGSVDGEIPERPIQPRHPPGLISLSADSASLDQVKATFGEPCTDETFWALTPDAYDEADEAEVGAILVVTRGILLSLRDGRAALIMPATSSEVPELHFYLAAMLLSDQSHSRPTLMSGMGLRVSGELYLPEQQPHGAFHVWQEGGPEADRWLGVTDFSGASPAPLGVFPSRGEYRCREGGCDQKSYRLTSIRYADTGPGGLTLKWDVQLYQEEADCALEQACGRHEVGRRIYVANYLLTSSGYALLGGEEPLPE